MDKKVMDYELNRLYREDLMNRAQVYRLTYTSPKTRGGGLLRKLAALFSSTVAFFL